MQIEQFRDKLLLFPEHILEAGKQLEQLCHPCRMTLG
jgi:hypothetical protein